MSVFTRVSESDAIALLNRFDLGKLVSLQGIASGIENTNYFLTTERNQFVLTLFELLSADELPFFLNLMVHLAEQSIPCPRPMADLDGLLLQTVNHKPASLVSRLSGHSIEFPDEQHCHAVGNMLAHIHLAGAQFDMQRDNPRAATWWKQLAPRLAPVLSSDDVTLLQEEIRYQSLHRLQDLPRGIIHADLFRDNVLFDGHALSGIIDFYFACTDTWLYDVAITVNDWCIHPDGTLDHGRSMALLQGYHNARPFVALERGAWPVVLRAAALRFWVSRLYDLHFPRDGEITHAKDPNHFRDILRSRIETQSNLRRLWV